MTNQNLTDRLIDNLMSRKPDPATVEIIRYPVLPPSDKPALILVYKPSGLSSFAVVKRIRYLTKVKKVGHSGTLDPMATGLLIVMLAKATRLMDSLLQLGKTYEGTIRLGEQTPSFDAETPVTKSVDPSGITLEQVETAATTFIGTIEQQTPVYSAVKVKGERLYKKARRGEHVVLPGRIVTVSEFEITSKSGPDVDFRVHCGSGTYIRALANDIGELLGVGGHLTRLRRTSIGDYAVTEAWALADLDRSLSAGELATGG